MSAAGVPQSPESVQTTEKHERKPVIFMLQPTEFLPVPPDKLKEWGERLRTVLGENAPKVHRLLTADGSLFETTSICPGGGADDCDVFARE